MRINKYIARATGISRRNADTILAEGRVLVNKTPASLGDDIQTADVVSLDGIVLTLPLEHTTIILNKPVDYVCSRNGQGSKPVYDLLPEEYKVLKIIGRLDKDSSGILLLTNDGDMANRLAHPRYQKIKIYEVSLVTPLTPLHQQMISDNGIQLQDGVSKLLLESMDANKLTWKVTMHEGRNRQIRRTFEALGYQVRSLHRIQFGTYALNDLAEGKFLNI